MVASRQLARVMVSKEGVCFDCTAPLRYIQLQLGLCMGVLRALIPFFCMPPPRFPPSPCVPACRCLFYAVGVGGVMTYDLVVFVFFGAGL